MRSCSCVDAKREPQHAPRKTILGEGFKLEESGNSRHLRMAQDERIATGRTMQSVRPGTGRFGK